jgi:SPOR domain
MSEEVLHHDDQSHYEVSLTAGQAFMAFVLLLLSLAASFAFGLLIGKGQSDDRLVMRKDPAVINEAAAAPAPRRATPLPELGVSADDFQPSTPARTRESRRQAAAAAEEPAALAPVITDAAPSTEAHATTPIGLAQHQKPAVTAPKPEPAAVKPLATGPAYAQILSTADQKTADALAAKLIDSGFNSAYVERIVTEKGTAFRVRVRFSSESEARANESKLKEFSKDVWIVK